MADEQTRPPFKKPSTIPRGYDWPSLLDVEGDALEIHYRHILETLGKERGMLGVIFRKAQNKEQDPAKLRRLIADLIDKEQWTSLEADVKGGGTGETVRRELLKQCDVHTLLRLPTGIFYAQGVKANVLFFDRKPASEEAWTKKLWTYDFRTNQHFTLKTNSLKRPDLDDFVTCFNPENRHQHKESERFKAFAYEDLLKRDKMSLDIFWLKDESPEDSANLPDPDVIAAEIAEDLQAALDQFTQIALDLKR